MVPSSLSETTLSDLRSAYWSTHRYAKAIVNLAPLARWESDAYYVLQLLNELDKNSPRTREEFSTALNNFAVAILPIANGTLGYEVTKDDLIKLFLDMRAIPG